MCEIADGADDVFVSVEGEWDDGDEAEGEPGPAAYNMPGIISTVVTLAGNSLVALELLGEFMLAAGEDETHVGGRQWKYS